MPIVGKNIRTLAADLADVNSILGHIPSENDVVVVSLHACGAASDYAMNLAHVRDAPFVVCPCCTAKSLTKREDSTRNDTTKNNNASFQRSGATSEITYPRSKWLNDVLNSNDADAEYAILAKVADVGLGPQTPSQQRGHQRRAKHIVELDRLAYSSSREYGYETGLVRVRRHDPTVYGKGEMLLGAKGGSVAAGVFGDLLLE